MKINNAFLVSFSKSGVNINRVVSIGLSAQQKKRLGRSVYFGQPINKNFDNTVKDMKNFNSNSLISEDPFKETLTDILPEWNIIQTIVSNIQRNQPAAKLQNPDFRIIVLEEIIMQNQCSRFHIIPIRRGAKVVNKDWTWVLKGALLQGIQNVGSIKIPLTAEFDVKPFINLDFEIVVTFDIKFQMVKNDLLIKSIVQYVFDVKGQQYAFKLHEINHDLAYNTLSNFVTKPAEYTISSAKYQVSIVNYQHLLQVIKDDASIINRLAKYQGDASHFDLQKIIDANEKLNAADRVKIDDVNKQIIVTKDCIGTFTALIHDLLLQRLITGNVELPLKNYH